MYKLVLDYYRVPVVTKKCVLFVKGFCFRIFIRYRQRGVIHCHFPCLI